MRDGKIRGTKTHYLKGNQLHDIDSLFQSLIFSYYQSSFSLPKKIILSIKPNNLPLIKQAVKLKFGKQISISANINSNIRKVSKLGKLNANQVIENIDDYNIKLPSSFWQHLKDNKLIDERSKII